MPTDAVELKDIQKLPTEMVLAIVSWLPDRDVAHASVATREFRSRLGLEMKERGQKKRIAFDKLATAEIGDENNPQISLMLKEMGGLPHEHRKHAWESISKKIEESDTTAWLKSRLFSEINLNIKLVPEQDRKAVFQKALANQALTPEYISARALAGSIELLPKEERLAAMDNLLDAAPYEYKNILQLCKYVSDFPEEHKIPALKKLWAAGNASMNIMNITSLQDKLIDQITGMNKNSQQAIFEAVFERAATKDESEWMSQGSHETANEYPDKNENSDKKRKTGYKIGSFKQAWKKLFSWSRKKSESR